eukprot:1154585-Pelagomonas_calceolata.AAC.1
MMGYRSCITGGSACRLVQWFPAPMTVTEFAGLAGGCEFGGQNDVINSAKRVSGITVVISARGLVVGPRPSGLLFFKATVFLIKLDVTLAAALRAGGPDAILVIPCPNQRDCLCPPHIGITQSEWQQRDEKHHNSGQATSGILTLPQKNILISSSVQSKTKRSRLTSSCPDDVLITPYAKLTPSSSSSFSSHHVLSSGQNIPHKSNTTTRMRHPIN